MDRRIALLLAALLVSVALPVQAQPDPNPRPPIEMDGDVNSVDMAVTGGNFAAGSDDPSTPLTVEPGGIAWQLWAADGRTEQLGNSDPADCGGIGGADCNNDVAAVALDGGGTRLIVASDTEEGPFVQFITEQQFVVNTWGTAPGAMLEGTVTDLAFSEAGNTAVLGTATTGGEGRIYVFSWNGGALQRTVETHGPVNAVDVNIGHTTIIEESH